MIATTLTKVIYIGNGATKEFPITFGYADSATVKAGIYDPDTDQTTELTKDYYVDTVRNSVFYPGYAPGQAPPESEQPGPLPAPKKLVVYRVTPMDQTIDLGTKYPLPIIEKIGDKNTLIEQELAEKLGRAVLADIGSGKTVEDIQRDIHQDWIAANASAEHAAESARKAAESEGSAKNAASLATEQANKAKVNADQAEAARATTAGMRDETQTLKDAATNAADAAERSAGESAASAGSARNSEDHSGASKTSAEQSATEAKLAAQQAADSAEKAKQIAGGDFATPKQVDEKIAALVNQAPETLNTLSEIAQALGNDPNFATTITNLLGQKLNKADPAAELGVGGTGRGAKLKVGSGYLLLRGNGQNFEIVPMLGKDITVGTAQNCTGNAATATTAKTSGEATLAHGIPVGDKGGNIWID
nr:MAG TPA: Baseplate wedge protein [Caudoviricetes sp.]